MSSSSSSASLVASAAAATGVASRSDVDTPNEEGILVAIRMRPLNSREQSSSSGNNNENDNRVWRVLQKYNSIAQCTSSGKPLSERTQNRTIFSFDQTFGEASTTRQVYEQTSKGIVTSVASGLNGTIFAYGQTSSGKTFTMQGSGTLQDGSAASVTCSSSLDNGGIVHMAACDIFDHIEKETERVFLVRVSFIEIYNEEVRDLLVSGDSTGNATLKIREDKDRGVFVNSNETIVTSMDSLLSVLFAGEKNRSFAATAMNERSSRSHTIFRITVASRLKDTKKEDDDGEEESDEEGDLVRGGNDSGNCGAMRVSTLNLVDLAGSESVRHTGSTGDRQKEGGIINQSLLTLSRVISNLGQNATHINFRDSKLTRILQPSLSGNARMVIICCATPSELYLEETRSTLQFASRAKLVKTRAQVNEVMDDRSLIKKLQRELKEARYGGPGKDTIEQMKALEAKAVNAEVTNRKAEEDLKRMKELILKGCLITASGFAGRQSLYNSLFVYNDNDETIQADTVKFSLGKTAKDRQRRYSDGVINDSENADSQQQHVPFASPSRGGMPASSASIVINHPQTAAKPKRQKQTIQPSDIMTGDVYIGLLREALILKRSQNASLKTEVDEARRQAQSASEKLQLEQGEKEMMRLAKQELESQVSNLASEKEFAVTEQELLVEEKEVAIATALERIEQMLEECRQQALLMTDLQSQLSEKDGEAIAKEVESSSAIALLTPQVTELESARVLAEEHVATLEVSFEAERQNAAHELSKVVGELETTQVANTKLKDQVLDLEKSVDEASKRLMEKETALETATASIAAFKEDASSESSTLSAVMDRLRNANNELNEEMITLKADLIGNVEALMRERDTAIEKMNAVLSSNGDSDEVLLSLNKEKDELASALEQSKADVARLEAEKDEVTASLNSLQEMIVVMESQKAQIATLTKERDELEAKCKKVVAVLETTLETKSREINELKGQLDAMKNQFVVADNHVAASDAIDSLKNEVKDLKSLLASTNTSVDKARSAARKADKELQETKLQLENALCKARHTAEVKIRSMELSLHNSTRADSEEELFRDMELLMGENIDAESRLEQELSRRKEFEDGIKRTSEEEEQQLIDEAEEKMISLRDEISQLKSDLSRVETDCYSMKDANVELQEKQTKLDARANDLEGVLTLTRDQLATEKMEKLSLQEKLQALEEQSAVFKSQVFAAKASFEADAQARLADVEYQLNDALHQLSESRKEVKASRMNVADLNSDIDKYRREIDSIKCMTSNETGLEMSKLREELAQTKLDLTHSEADCLAARRELKSAKEKVSAVKKHEYEKQQKFAAKAKEAIETLKGRLAKAESIQNGPKEAESLQDELKALKKNIDEKEERIKKLEKSKITKTHIANIKKLKDERSQFMAEAKEYKQRVEELESVKPCRNGSRDRKDVVDQSEEIEKLQDYLRQCENKLWKYVQHSERLEKDRNGVIEAISSCDVADVVGDSVVEMVVSLCEKLTSIEEECMALVSSEGKASEYLSELDALREKYSELEAEVKVYEVEDAKMTIPSLTQS